MAAWILRCPECGTKFRSPTVEGPEYCPSKECGAYMRDDDEGNVIEIAAPFIRSAKMKATDGVYTALEKTSEFRAEQAAQMAGVSASEMSSLKITNMRDNVKPGESYAPSIAAEQSRLESAGAKVQFAGSNASEYSGAVMAGPYPNSGAKMRTALSRLHGANGGTTGGVPALETQQPGYRIRG